MKTERPFRSFGISVQLISECAFRSAGICNSRHTEVVFDISEGQKEFCDKLFARKGRVEE